jgi:S1-C subfamily serine protease
VDEPSSSEQAMPEEVAAPEDQTASPGQEAEAGGNKTGEAGETARGWRQKCGAVAGYAAAGMLITGIGFGAFTAARDLAGPGGAASAIPAPPRANARFVEDDDGTGADNQVNILRQTIPGLVHVATSRGTPTGVGTIITPSGIVLTSDQAIGGADRVVVRQVLTGKSLSARVIGSDAAADLALLQIEGGSEFATAAIGNSRDFAVGAAVTSVGSSGLSRTFTLNVGNLVGTRGSIADAGGKLTRLLTTTTRVLPGEETGGPLVSLSGQVIGIDVAGAGSGLRHVGFAVPIDTALAIARKIDGTR